MSRSAASAAAVLTGLISTAIRTALGKSSRRNPSRLAASSWEKKLMRVALPPGRARLATRPNLTGSSPTPNTIGIVVVAAFAACAIRLPGVAMTATRRRTRSAMRAGRRSYWPSSQWYSTIAFWLSKKAGFVEALTERRGTAHIGRPADDESNDRHRRLLRASRKRPRRRRASDQRDELTPPHGAFPK